MTAPQESSAPAVTERRGGQGRRRVRVRLPTVHPALRWPLRAYKWVLTFLALGLVSNIAVLLFSNGFAGFLPAARAQVAALLAFVSQYPLVCTGIVLALVLLFVLAWRAEQDYEQEVAARTAALHKQQAMEAGRAGAEEALRGFAASGQPAPPSILRTPRELPPRSPGFVGRQGELRTLVTDLHQGQSIGLSAAVAGMAGVGKSALAAEAVHLLAAESDAFRGGITFVRCDDRGGLPGLSWLYDQLLTAWGVALSANELARGATPETEIEVREHALRARLQAVEPGQEPAPALVLLDNVERDLPLGRLLDTLAPLGITVLSTSRHQPASLRLQLLPLDVLAPDAAVQLFAERYAARGGSWEQARDVAPATEVVEALGWLPLAIELAAARAARAQTGVAALAAELGEADRLGKLRDPLDPTASVRYVFARSLDVLTVTERVRFAVLGLPDGPDWPRPVIERLLAAVPPEMPAGPRAAPAGDDLDALVALSLVTLLPGETPEDGPRVRVHPLVRELAQEEWVQLSAGDQQAALEALLAGVRSWVEAHQTLDAGYYRVFAQDEDLIAGALRTAMARQVGLPQVTSIIEAWGRYLFVRNERLDYEMRSLQVYSARAIGDPLAELAALNGLIQISGLSGREDEAARLRGRALILARELGDRVEILRMLGAIGEEMAARGSRAEAAQLYAEAQALARELGDRFTDFDALNNVGNAARTLGRLDDAAEWYQRAIASAHAAGDLLYELMSKSNLALVYDQLGQLAAARTLFEEMRQFDRQFVDYPYGFGSLRNALGQLALKMGNLDEAAGYLTEALPFLEQGGHAELAAQTRANLILLAGLQALRRGDREAAAQAFEQALQQFEAIGRLSDAVDQRPFVRQLLAELHAPPVASAPASASEPSSVSTAASAAVPVAGDGSSTRTKRRRWPWSRG